MPYPNIEAAKKANFPTTAEDISLTLTQVNHLAEIYDAVKKQGDVENAMAVAWTQWKKLYEKKDVKWSRKAQKFLSEELVSIKHMEIFRIGTWNKSKFTEEDLKTMANNFKELKGILVPKIKITHRKNQKSLAGLASYGDVINMYTEDMNGETRLYADIECMPLQVAEWIKDRRFAERSIELYNAYSYRDKIYRKVVSAIALLGHAIPAVAGMTSIELSKEDNELESEELIGVNFALDDKSIEFEIENLNKKGGDIVEIKELIGKISGMEATIANFIKMQEDAKTQMAKEKQVEKVTALEADIKKYSEQIENTKTLKTEYEKMKTEYEKDKKEKAEAFKKIKEGNIDIFITQIKTEGKILPAFEQEVKSLLMSLNEEGQIGKFSREKDGKTEELELSQFEALKSLISKLPKLVDFKEYSHTKAGAETKDIPTEKTIGTDTFELSSAELNVEAEKYMEEHKDCSREDALIFVSSKRQSEGKEQ